jgi:hypothetical protein
MSTDSWTGMLSRMGVPDGPFPDRLRAWLDGVTLYGGGLVENTDTTFSSGITYPTISFEIQRFLPSEVPSQSIRFTSIRRYEYESAFSNSGIGHCVAGLDWYAHQGAGNPHLAYAHESKIDNETTATITTAVGSESQLSSNAGTITNLLGFNSRITGNAGTVDSFVGYSVGITSNSGTINSITGYEFADLGPIAPGATRAAIINRDPGAPILSAGPVIDQSITYASPAVEGFSTTVPSGKQVMLMTPAAAYSAGTINMAVKTSVHDGQTIEITSTQSVGAVTWGANGATFVYGGPASIAAGQTIRFRYFLVLDWWIRI